MGAQVTKDSRQLLAATRPSLCQVKLLPVAN